MASYSSRPPFHNAHHSPPSAFFSQNSPVHSEPWNFSTAERASADLYHTYEALRESERGLYAMVENIPDPLLVVDQAGQILFANRIVGTLSAEEALHHTLFDFFDETFHESISDCLLQAIRETAPCRFFARSRESGRDVVYQGRVTALTKRDEHPTFLILLQNVTEQKRLQETYRHLTSVMAFLPDALIEITPAGRVIGWNSGAEHLYGFPAHEILGQSISVLFLEGEVEFNSLANRVTRGEQIRNLRVERRTKTGERRASALTIFPSRDTRDNITGLTFIERDMTNQKNVEENVARGRELLDFSHEAIIELTPDGHVQGWNKAAEALYGYEWPEVNGQFFFDLVSSGPGAGDDNRRLLEAAQGQKTGPFDAVHTRKNGHKVEVSIRLEPLRPANGDEASFCAVIRDLSDQRRLEQKILDVSDWQQKRIGRDLHDELSHCLLGISSLCASLEKNLSDRLLPESADAIRIRQLVDRTIGKVREFTRGLTPAKLGTQLAHALQQLSADAEGFFQISCHTQADHTAVLEDEAAEGLFRIAQEAVTNAVKHGHSKRVDINLVRSGAWIILTVHDDGIGIGPLASENQGIGLSIMRGRAEAIGATLDIRPRADASGTLVECALRYNNAWPLSSLET